VTSCSCRAIAGGVNFVMSNGQLWLVLGDLFSGTGGPGRAMPSIMGIYCCL